MPVWRLPSMLLLFAVSAAAAATTAAAPTSQPADDGPFQFKETPLMKAAVERTMREHTVAQRVEALATDLHALLSAPR